ILGSRSRRCQRTWQLFDRRLSMYILAQAASIKVLCSLLKGSVLLFADAPRRTLRAWEAPLTNSY
ncbi:MAG TPA: hypothetical protein VEL78_03730, partial [Pyrinomonadaceae bacterium]|nr:hypothetical protein [Pyrinomonadaceae bacterium]